MGNWFARALLPLLVQGLVAGQASSAEALGGNAQRQPNEFILQDGTPVKLRLAKSLSSADAEVGQPVTFEVTNGIDIDGVTVLRRGASATGEVTAAHAKKRQGREGKLSFNLNYVRLADGEKANLRALNNLNGESHTAGVTALVLGMPMVSAPFFLLMKGRDASIPAGTEITAFINGDLKLDKAKFEAGAQSSSKATAQAHITVDSTPGEASIELDGSPAGHTPATVPVSLGSHTIVVRKEGFAAWSQLVTIGVDTVHIYALLEHLPAR